MAAAEAATTKLYVGNLNKTTSEDSLRNLFGRANITSIEMTQAGVFCWINFASEVQAQAALAINGTELDGYKLRVERHKPRLQRAAPPAKVVNPKCVYAGNLPAAIEPDALTKLFEAYGAIESVKLRQFRGSSRSGHVTFAEEAGATAALALNNTTVQGRVIRVELEAKNRARPKKNKEPKEEEEKGADRPAVSAGASVAPREVNPLRVFVGHLPRDLQRTALADHFASCGVAKAVAFRKGFGFVTLNDAQGVKDALALNGSSIGGREISVEPEVLKEGRAPKPRVPKAVKETVPDAGEVKARPKRRRVRKGRKNAERPAPAPVDFPTVEPPRARKPREEKKADPEATVWIGNLTEAATKADIKAAAEDVGIVERVRYTARSRFAFVVFAAAATAEKALARGSFSIAGALASVEKLQKRKELGRVFVGGLTTNATEADVRGAFAAAGEITKVSIKSTEEKTFAHVTFTNAEAAANVVGGNYSVGGAAVFVEASRSSRKPFGRRKGGAAPARAIE